MDKIRKMKYLDQFVENEISKSLRQFAKSNYIINPEPVLDMDEVREDFARNGIISEEFICNQPSCDCIFNNSQIIAKYFGCKNYAIIKKGKNNSTCDELSCNNENILNNSPFRKPSFRSKKCENTLKGNKKAKTAINWPEKNCVFCKNNNEPMAVVKSHNVRDEFGKVLCPKLRVYTCPICGASGDEAHTLKYCPKKRIVTMEDTIRTDLIRRIKSLRLR